eukprot:scaffold7494_cov113-Cylindrotheca_fusiformis.AAC.2
MDKSTTATTCVSFLSSTTSAFSSGSAAICWSVASTFSGALAFLSHTASVNQNFASVNQNFAEAKKELLEARKERLEMRLGLKRIEKRLLAPEDTELRYKLENEINDLERKMEELDGKGIGNGQVSWSASQLESIE